MKQGFTLVEILLALGVLAVGLLSLFALLPSAASWSRELRDQESSLRLAESVQASLQWHEWHAGATNRVALAEALELPQINGPQNLSLESGEHAFPDVMLPDELSPVLFYELRFSTNSWSEAQMQVRNLGGGAEVEVDLHVLPEQRAW